MVGAAATRKVRVVVGDDQPMFRDGVVRALASSGSSDAVTDADDGVTALDLIRTHLPQVALLDYRRPGMDGAEVAAAVRRHDLPTRVLLVSAHDESAIVYRCRYTAVRYRPHRQSELRELRLSPCAWTGDRGPHAGSKPPPTRCSGAIAATDAISATSYACTFAARPIIRTAVRAASNTPNGDITCPRLRTPQIRAAWCLRLICACNMSHPLCDPLCFENRGWWVVCLQGQPPFGFPPVGVARYRLARSRSAARPHPVR